MFELLIIAFTLGFSGAWLTSGFLSATNYGALLGWLRERIADYYASNQDLAAKEHIIKKDNNILETCEELNSEYYWYVAKHSKVVYLLMCKYCLGFWFAAAILYFFFSQFYVEQYNDFLLIIIVSYSSLYFNLNYQK